MFLSGRRGIKQCGALLGVAETGVAPTPTSKNPSTAKNQNKKYLLYPPQKFLSIRLICKKHRLWYNIGG